MAIRSNRQIMRYTLIIIVALLSMGMRTEPESWPHLKRVIVRISIYSPWLGGDNCSWFVNGKCTARMASGLHWEPFVGKACACPKEFPFGTVFYITNERWTCLDRGGLIYTERDGTIRLDLLTAKHWLVGRRVTVYMEER